MGISDALVDLGMLLVQAIPQLPKSAGEVLSAADLVLKCLQEALASDVSSWDRAWDRRRADGFGSPTPSPFHFLFYFASLGVGCNIHLYIYVCVCVVIGYGKPVPLHPSARVPNRNELGPWGLG
jgi:hypothetical protein